MIIKPLAFILDEATGKIKEIFYCPHDDPKIQKIEITLSNEIIDLIERQFKEILLDKSDTVFTINLKSSLVGTAFKNNNH